MELPPWLAQPLQKLTAQRSRSAHAWLISGPPGLGKTVLALNAAAQVVAGGDERGWHLVRAGSHPDLHVLTTEALCAADPGSMQALFAQRYLPGTGGKSSKPKAIISVDQVRRLTAGISTHAHLGNRKAVIIAPADRMNINAANALLKVLEEPSAGTVFILVSSEVHRLPATVRSRCVRLDLALPDEATALQWLEHNSEMDSDQAQAALQLAGGAPLAAVAMANNDFMKLHTTVQEDFQRLIMSVKDADPVVAAARWKALNAGQAVGILQRLLVDTIRCRTVSDPPCLFHPSARGWLQAGAERINLEKAYALTDRVGRYLQDLDGPLDASLVLEDLLIDLTRLSR